MDDIIVGKGLANALTYFGKRGMLMAADYGDGNQAQMFGAAASNNIVIGRSNDQTLEKQLKEHGLDQNQEKDRVKLQYRDKEGNQLSLKQAFRELCWSFHGKKPSHKQQIKQQRQIDSQKGQFKQDNPMTDTTIKMPTLPLTVTGKAKAGSSIAPGIQSISALKLKPLNLNNLPQLKNIGKLTAKLKLNKN